MWKEMQATKPLIEDPKQLCLDLLKAESEEEVTEILEKHQLLDDSLWCDLGGDENNFAIIGNQMSSPAPALVEKIINSIDAVLMARCVIAGIDPESAAAPQSMGEAADRFLGVRNVSLTDLSSTERAQLAEKSIWMIATSIRRSTGEKESPCYTFVDLGEGQSPKRMPETFLSIFTKSRKIRIPFVQGRFQMGGTGVLPYCGSKKYELIISKRHPKIAESESDDSTVGLWGFTIVRRVPRPGVRSSVYRYLALGGLVPSFSADEIRVLPEEGNRVETYVRPIRWGTCIKLYDYQFDVAAFKTNLKLDLSRELDRHLVSMPIPVRLCECRDYEQKSLFATLAGMDVRLDENRSRALEDNFPSSAILPVTGLGDLPVQIFLFKRNAGRRFISKKSAILFILNGQTHGAFPSGFFLRRGVQLDYLKDDLLVIADCTRIPGVSRDDLFMTSRDRLRESASRKSLEEQLELMLRNHRGLQDSNRQRELEASRDSLKDNKLLEKLIDRMLSFTPSLASYFLIGDRLTSAIPNGGAGQNYVGKKFPTYFRLLNEPQGGLVKECPSNAKCAVVFETDVENQYLTRKSDPGKISVIPAPASAGMLLWNGRGILFLKIPEGVEPNTSIEVTTEVADGEHSIPFTSTFKLRAIGPVAIKKKPRVSRKKKKVRKLALPTIVKVQRKDWPVYGFDESSGLKMQGSTLFVNVDNTYLLTEKSRSRTHPAILEEQFINGLVISCLAIRHDFTERTRKGQITLEEADIRERIEECSRGLAAVIIPMIQQLDTLKIRKGVITDTDET
jgi:hypothetical protein